MRPTLPALQEWEGSVLAFQRRRRVLPRIALGAAVLLVAETALLVANSGDAVALNLARHQESAASAPKKSSAKEAADIPSARVAARLYGHRVEALSERT